MKQYQNTKPFQLIVILIFLLIACNQSKPLKFSKPLWNQSGDPAFPPPQRKAMLKDLLENRKLIGLSYNDLIDLLGQPNGFEDSCVFYTIEVDYNGDVDPTHSKSLSFNVSPDSVITAFQIKEWNK